ncbi:astakine-like [Phymastichus coffea]|uniref:astakine-like n=1 Tax=Phymastichus coffea TaxID=108790 RepID=UPI00273AD924|nr:astakine-like [Phymastichus coffea]
MTTATGLFVLLSVVACTLAENQSQSASNVECKSDTDCKRGYCCAIGQQRYSYPQCQPLRAKGDLCRPGEPLLVSGPFYYPDITVTLSNVHLTLCPCADDLVCSRTDGQCHVA